MPEGDNFERTFQSGWRSAFRYIREGNGSTDEICDKLTKTLTDKLRKAEGIPGHKRLTEVICGSMPEDLAKSFGAIDDIVRELGGHQYTKIAADVAKSMIVQQPDGSALGEADTRKTLVEKTCYAIIGNAFFSRAEFPLVSEGRFASVGDFRAWQGQQEQAMQANTEKIADQLIARPDAKGLKAPKRMSPKKSTSALLGENLL